MSDAIEWVFSIFGLCLGFGGGIVFYMQDKPLHYISLIFWVVAIWSASYLLSDSLKELKRRKST
jgi:hypothetical protein